MKQWYCASYEGKDAQGNEVFPDCDYFDAYTDDDAIEIAKEYAANGIDYVDCGHVKLDLISVCKVDPENEWEETETIWF